MSKPKTTAFLMSRVSTGDENEAVGLEAQLLELQAAADRLGFPPSQQKPVKESASGYGNVSERPKLFDAIGEDYTQREIVIVPEEAKLVRAAWDQARADRIASAGLGVLPLVGVAWDCRVKDKAVRGRGYSLLTITVSSPISAESESTKRIA